ncbi:hypothetical protein GCM10009117_03640 [Gangjinia marincola]|uniref:Glycosyl transferase family 1 domain-containing protein n=2 Tax=Gangjinia marincola TaxID=578463 RepID=A0ABP3XS98_9FLAO
MRLVEMVKTVIQKRNWANVVLIDTYSTANFWYAYVIAKLCRRLGIPYIPILHGGNLPNRLEQTPKAAEAIFKYAFINVAPSGYLKESFLKNKFSNTILIPNTIEIDRYTYTQRDINTPKLLWVRSFAQLYNPILALKTLELILNDYPNAQLCMVGPDKDGSQKECFAYAEEKNLPVTFTGKLEKEVWIKLAEEYNIFLSTTNFDNTPVSVIEAMALGLPVISTNVGGVPFLIDDNVDGMLVEKDRPDQIRDRVEQLMNNEQQRRLLVENARNKVEKFDWAHVKHQWNDLLSSI